MENHNLEKLEVNSEAWKDQFANLTELSYQESMEQIESSGVITGKKIPFLNLDNATLEHGLTLENCDVTGMAAHSTIFDKKIKFYNCLFRERVNLNRRKKENKNAQSVFNGYVDITDCYFNDTFMLKNSIIHETFTFKNCHVNGLMSLDKSIFEKNVTCVGPGNIVNCSMYYSKFAQGLTIENYTFDIYEEKSMDLKGIKVDKIFEINNCKIQGNIILNKASIGSESYHSLSIKSSELGSLDMRESIYHGKVEFVNVRFNGKVFADVLRSKDGEKIAKSVLFKDDLAFMESIFLDECFFNGARFNKYFNINKTVFEKGANFSQAEFRDLCSLWRVLSKESMAFKKAHFYGDTKFGKVDFKDKTSLNQAEFDNNITIFDSKFEGDAFFSKAIFSKNLKINNTVFLSGLNLQKIIVENTVKIIKSSIKNRLILTESEINGAFLAPQLKIGTWASIAKSTIKGEVELGKLKIGTELNQESIDKIKNDVKERKLEIIEGSLYCSDSSFHGNLNLSAASIPGQLALNNTNVRDEFNISRAKIGHDLLLASSYFQNIVSMEQLECAGKIDSFNVRYKEDVSFNNLRCQNLSLSESSFGNSFTMRHCRIENHLILNNVDVDAKADLIKCKFGRIFFYNFLVNYLLIDRKNVGEKITSEKEGNYTQAKNEYGILKQAFHKNSQYKDMDWAYYRFCISKRKSKKISLLKPFQSIFRFFDWLFLDLGFGYGTKPMNIGGISLGIILIFACIFCACPNGFIHQSQDMKPVQLQNISFTDSIYLSIITFASMDYGDCVPDFTHWLKHLLAIEGLIGIFLITLFVATISRKIIRA